MSIALLPEDPFVVNINSEEHIKRWCNEFNCTKEELVFAVKAIGPEPKNVKRMVKDLQENGFDIP